MAPTRKKPWNPGLIRVAVAVRVSFSLSLVRGSLGNNDLWSSLGDNFSINTPRLSLSSISSRITLKFQLTPSTFGTSPANSTIMSHIQNRLNASSCSGCSDEAHSCSFCSTLLPTFSFHNDDSKPFRSTISVKSVNEALRNGCLFAKLFWKEAQPETIRIPGVSTECTYEFKLEFKLRALHKIIDISYSTIHYGEGNVKGTHYVFETSLSFYLSTSSGMPFFYSLGFYGALNIG